MDVHDFDGTGYMVLRTEDQVHSFEGMGNRVHSFESIGNRIRSFSIPHHVCVLEIEY